MENAMFCFQCQETAHGTGCTVKGVCGKDAALSEKMDILIFVVKGVSVAADLLRKNGLEVPGNINHYVTDALFSTITNANFCSHSIEDRIEKGLCLREQLKNTAKDVGISLPDIPELEWHGSGEDENNMRAAKVGILREKDENVRSLKELITYGLKGMSAYLEHAMRLKYNNVELHRFIQGALAGITLGDLSVEELLGLALETGEQGIKAMELLDKANTGTFGHPQITKVKTGTGKNPGILISGHDLHDLEMLLEQTQGTGVDVYTHCEMLPGHYYPAFKKYKHFIGNYGGAWWQQKSDFEKFNGPVIFTSNCIVPPAKEASYREKIFTCNSSAYPGAKYIKEDNFGKKDFSEVIEMAKRSLPPQELENGEITGGFAHNQTLELAEKIIDAINRGAIGKFVVMAGCDGRQKSREYYTEFAGNIPDNWVILTAGCAKFRYNKLKLNDIEGIPRVLDAGQCNDSYSLIKIASALKEATGSKDINSLPIMYNIAWYEQKAVIVLLALLSLGIKNIHLGPTLPAFLSPAVTGVLVEKFGISGKV